MKRSKEGKNSEKDLFKITKRIFLAYILVIIIILFIIISWTLYLSSTRLYEPPDLTPKSEFFMHDASEILNDSEFDQTLNYITLESGELIKWSDLIIQISKDGNDFYDIRFNTSVLGINMSKFDNNLTDPVLWDIGDILIFSENGSTNWESNTYFYCKIIYGPSRKAILEEKVMVI